jgi:outer membrane protein assembly factor BamB
MCTDWKVNTIYCYTLTGQEIWTFKDENVLRTPMGIALDIVTATMFSPVYETSYGIPENRTMSFS